MNVQRRQRGFTLTEVMITVGIVAIVAGIAIPSYSSYLQRSRVPAALNALTSFATRMEQYYQDNNRYGTSTCGQGMALPVAEKFTVTCSLTNSGQGFLATATGISGTPVQGFTYTIDQQGNRKTTAHPAGALNNCWTLKGKTCDA
jgi:type IV pilus assembly protein PilE